MIPAGQSIIRSGALAQELGVAPSTLTKWSKKKLASARHGRGVFLVQKLRALGVLPIHQEQPIQAPRVDAGGLVVITIDELRQILREELRLAMRT